MAYTTVTSPITYYGGKTSILPYLREMEPEHNVYTETFIGGGAWFWDKKPKKNETINDRLDIVVNFYKTLRLNYKPLKRLIDATLISRTIYNEAGNIIRAHRYGVGVDKVQLAWALWMHTNFSYMHKITGGYKQQKDGGKSIAKELQAKKISFTEAMAERIENTVIENEHWLKVVNARNAKDALHYLDPSYPGTDQGMHHKFTWADMEELLDWCETYCTGKFLLSNYNSDLLTRYTKRNGWFKKEITHELKKPRNGKTTKTEVLISNYSTPCGTLKLF